MISNDMSYEYTIWYLKFSFHLVTLTSLSSNFFCQQMSLLFLEPTQHVEVKVDHRNIISSSRHWNFIKIHQISIDLVFELIKVRGSWAKHKSEC